MAMSGSRLTGTLDTDILAQIQSAFPIDASLKTAEKAGIAAAQSALAQAIANAAGPDIVNEVKNASIGPGTFTNGAGSVTGAGAIS